MSSLYTNQSIEPNPPTSTSQIRSFSPADISNMDLMFYQIKSGIKQLLESVSIMYRHYGITYPVHQYFDSVLRMLAPVELLGFVNAYTVNSMFEGGEDKNQPEEEKAEPSYKDKGDRQSIIHEEINKIFTRGGNPSIRSRGL